MTRARAEDPRIAWTRSIILRTYSPLPATILTVSDSKLDVAAYCSNCGREIHYNEQRRYDPETWSARCMGCVRSRG